jgi:hypothetical protein
VPEKKSKGGAPVGNQNALGNSGGAPQIYTNEWISNEAKLFREWMQKPDSLYFSTFAVERGYDRQRLNEFADKSVEFSDALKFAKNWQESRLVNYGLKNETNPSITKFVLQNCHGWADKQQVSGDASCPLGFILQKADGDSKDLLNGHGK